jgi:hypothetical protein
MGTMPSADQSLSGQAVGADDDDGYKVSRPRTEATIILAKTSTRTFPEAVLLGNQMGSDFYLTGRYVNVEDLAIGIQQPDLELLILAFLTQHTTISSQVFNKPISVFSSAVATFYAPSDKCRTGGMRTERIRATPSWRKGEGRYDCVFVKDPSSPTPPNTLHDLGVAHVRAFFSSTYRDVLYMFALIHSFKFVYKEPDEDTGMWIVKCPRDPCARLVSLDAIYRAAHLVPVYDGRGPVQKTQTAERSLDQYRFFYVNKFIDHHAFEIGHEH